MLKVKQKITSILVACATALFAIVLAIGAFAYTPKTIASAAEGSYVKVTEAPSDWSGEYLIVYEAGNVAFNGSLSTLDANNNNVAVTITENMIAGNPDTKAIAVTITQSGTSYTIKTASGYYIGATANSNSLNSNESTQYTNSITFNNGDVDIKGSGGAYLRFNSSSSTMRFRYYKSSSYTNQKAIQLYKWTENNSGSETPDCEHTNAQSHAAVEATCETAGNIAYWHCDECDKYFSDEACTEEISQEDTVIPASHKNTTTETVYATCNQAGSTTVTCDDCGATVSTETIPATGVHNYVDGTCTVCNAKEPNEKTATLSFADVAQRTTYTTSQQVWEQNGVTVTNNKASSTTNVGNYVNPARFYKSSEIIVTHESGAITKVIVDCSGIESKYATPFATDLANIANATLTSENQVYTVTFSTPVENLTISSISAQARANSITVYYDASGECEHTGGTATCTEPAICELCGEEYGEALGHTEETVAAVAPTCEETGLTEGKKCSVCDTVILAQEVVDALGHDFAEPECTPNGDGTHDATGTCNVCGATTTETKECVYQRVDNGTTCTYTCPDCEHSYTTDKYTVTYNVINGAEANAAEQIEVNTDVTFPTAATISGYTFVGWMTEEYSANQNKPTVTIYKANETYKVTEDISFYALYTYGGTTLVEDASTLKVGQQIIIAASESNVALSTTQNSNNRGQATITKDGNAVTFGDDVQVITLEEGNVAGTFAFNVGSGYLYAASSSANHLRTKDELDDDGSWLITIADGVATIKAQGNNTNNWLRYNKTSSLFSCYGETSTQKDVSIYTVSEALYTTSTVATITQATVSIGDDLKLNYYVSMADTLASAEMLFTVDGDEMRVIGEKVGEQYKFTLSLAPQYMATDVEAELIFNGLIIASKYNYSIKEYAQNQLNKIEAGEIHEKASELKQLLTDMLAYGAAAQEYKNYNVENLANADVDYIGTASEAVPAESDSVFNIASESLDSYGAWFTAANVWFGDVNKIIVKINTTDNVTLKINHGEEFAVTSTTILTDGIKATGFADTYTFYLFYNGELMQTLTYSVNSYIYKTLNSTNDYEGKDKMIALAKALYNYGESAENFAQ